MLETIFTIAITKAAGAHARSFMSGDLSTNQNEYSQSKRDIIDAILQLIAPERTAFGELYNEYETERKILEKVSIELMKEYMKNQYHITEIKADELVKTGLKNDIALEKLYSKYYELAKKVTSVINAATFIQTEIALQTIIKDSTKNAAFFISKTWRADKTSLTE